MGKYVFSGLLVALVVIGLVLRLWHLSLIPVALYHDELDHVFTGEAVARYGTDITGNWDPLQLKPLKTINYTAELPAVFHAVSQKIFGYGADTAHIPNAFFGLASIVILGYLAYLVTKRKDAGLFVAILLLLSPWHTHLSRMTYEATISLFFQLLFITAFVYAITRHIKTTRDKIITLTALAIAFFGAYFTYHGAKFTMITISIVTVVFAWFTMKNRHWRIAICGLIMILLTLHIAHTVLARSNGVYGERQSELIFTNAHIEKIVNDQRRLSVSLPFSRLFSNKPAIIAQEAIKHYGSVFDLNRLFLTGYEGGFQFSLIVHGFFYLSGLLLIPLGIWWSWRKNQQLTLLLIALLVVSPITSTITLVYQSIFRSALTYTLLLLFAGFGVAAVFDALDKKKWQLLKLLVLLVLLAEAIWFGYRYFGQFPVLSSDNHYFSEKLLAGYLHRVSGPTLVIMEKEPYTKARAYLSYTGKMPSLSEEEKEQFNAPFYKDFRIGETLMTTDCIDLASNLGSTWVIEQSKFENCNYESFLATSSALLRAQPVWQLQKGLGSAIDSHAYYLLLNDRVCPDTNLNSFIYVNQIQKYDATKLTNEDFCNTWVLLVNQIVPPATP